MADSPVAKFFAEVYKDRSLQGALHHALVRSAPDVVVEIAKKKGFQFSSKDLAAAMEGGQKSGELSEESLSGAVGGAVLSAAKLSSVSLQRNFWGSMFGRGAAASGFELTIPGPSFVLVQSPVDRETPALEGETEASAVSAVDLYRDLTAK
jgi:predicted ribosomally synthesized peptide with nif11-like leader